MPDDFPKNATADAFDDMIRGIPLPLNHKPQPRGDIELPAGTRIISADTHWTFTGDIFSNGFPIT